MVFETILLTVSEIYYYNEFFQTLFFQLWYETYQDIPAGAELCLSPKEPLNLQDMFGDSNSADEKSDRETGKTFFFN